MTVTETRTPAQIVQDSLEPARTFGLFLAQELEQWGFTVPRDVQLGEAHLLWVETPDGSRFHVTVKGRRSCPTETGGDLGVKEMPQAPLDRREGKAAPSQRGDSRPPGHGRIYSTGEILDAIDFGKTAEQHLP
jgi:hypothetical protein